MSEKSAKEELSKLTGRPVKDFDASGYDIPDFTEQELTVKSENEDREE